jgi:hypothetical protein
MINQDIIAQDLFYKIRSRFPKMEMGDEKGQPTFEATKGRFFDFEAVFEGQNLGTVSISINEPGSLKIYFSRNILEDADDYTSKTWFNFLKEMRKFAMKRLMSFDTRDISKTNLDKRDYSYLAKKESVMNESVKGTRYTSFKPLERTRLIIRHDRSKGPVDENIPGARSRNIESLFVENAIGERFKYPFKHLAGAKAMQRHVANEGVPHDAVGQAIIQMSEEIAQLSNFNRYVQREDLMNTETNHIVDRATVKLEALKKSMHQLSKQQHYEAFKNSIETGNASNELVIDEVTMEEYKDKFTVKNFKEDIANVFPLLYKIMQEENEIDLDQYAAEGKEEYCDACDRPKKDCVCDEEKNESVEETFERWANTLIETKLTPEEITELQQLVSEHFPVGLNGDNASASLESIGLNISNDLKMQLAKLAEEQGPDADAKPAVLEYLSKHEPDIYVELNVQENIEEIPVEKEDQPIKAEENMSDQTPDERKAANEYLMKVARAIKSGEVKPEEIEQEFFNTLPMMGVSDEKVSAAWDRITDHSGTPKKAAPMSDRDIDAELRGVDGGSEDDDAAFLANLRSKAKAGGVKQDTTGFGAGLDEESGEQKSQMRQIAEYIISFYNKEEGNFPLGEKAVAIKVGKEFGDKYEALAEKLCRDMAGQREERDAFEELRVLSGQRAPAEGNAFGKAVRDAKADGIQSGEKVNVGGEEYPVKESDLSDITKLAGLK